MTGPTILQAELLCAGYPGGRDDVIREISFTLHEGERLAVIGPNGCGKTTLLRALAGILPYRGHLLQTIRDPASRRHGNIVERASLSSREVARETGLLAQLSSPWFSFSVYETVMMGRYTRQKPGAFSAPSQEDRRAVEKALRDCGVLGIRDERLAKLSGGQLQRVFLARTLAQDPAILLLDEPTNHLDLHFQFELLELIDRWVSSGGHAAIGVFHDLSLAVRFADTMILLDDGRSAAWGSPRDIVNGAEINRIYRMNVAESVRALLQNW